MADCGALSSKSIQNQTVRVTLCILSFILFGCSTFHQSTIKPPIEFDSSYLNQQVRLLVVKYVWPPFKKGETHALVIEYRTPNKVVFPSNYNLRIFIEEDNGWIEINDSPADRSDDPIVLTQEDPSSFGHIVAFLPQYPILNKTYYVRVYVFGDMTTSEGIKQVAAFVDFVVNP
jgi:hypothetical protein